MEKLHHEIDRLLDEIIDDHIVVDNNTTSMHEDLVDVLLRVQNDEKYEITRKNIKAVILVSSLYSDPLLILLYVEAI